MKNQKMEIKNEIIELVEELEKNEISKSYFYSRIDELIEESFQDDDVIDFTNELMEISNIPNKYNQ